MQSYPDDLLDAEVDRRRRGLTRRSTGPPDTGLRAVVLGLVVALALVVIAADADSRADRDAGGAGGGAPATPGSALAAVTTGAPCGPLGRVRIMPYTC